MTGTSDALLRYFELNEDHFTFMVPFLRILRNHHFHRQQKVLNSKPITYKSYIIIQDIIRLKYLGGFKVSKFVDQWHFSYYISLKF